MTDKQIKWLEDCSIEQQLMLVSLGMAMQAVSAKKISDWIMLTSIGGKQKKDFANTIVTEFLLQAKKQDVVSTERSGYFVISDDWKDYINTYISKHNDFCCDLHAMFSTVFNLSSRVSMWTPPEFMRNMYIRMMQAIILNQTNIVNFNFIKEAIALKGIDTPQNLQTVIDKSNQEIMRLVILQDRFNLIGEETIAHIVVQQLGEVLCTGLQVEDVSKLVQNNCPPKIRTILQLLSIANAFIAGNFNTLIDLCQNNETIWAKCFELHCLRLLGKNTEAEILEKTIDATLSNENILVATPLSVFLLPQMLLLGKAKRTKLQSAIKSNKSEHSNALFMFLSSTKNIEQIAGIEKYRGETYKYIVSNCLDYLAKFSGFYWLNASVRSDEKISLMQQMTLFRTENSYYYELEFTQLFSYLFNDTAAEIRAKELKQQLGVERCLCESYTPPAEWELRLKQLCSLPVANSTYNAPPKEERLVWLVSPQSGEIQPILQKSQKNGSWSSGRNIALAKLKNKEVECVSEFDTKVISHLKFYNDYYGQRYEFEHAALFALVGHPLLFHANAPTVPMELVAEEVYLVVDESQTKCTFSFSHDLSAVNKLQKISTNKYSIVTLSESIKSVISIIGSTGMTVPNAAKPQVLNALKHLSGAIKIQSPLMGEQTGASRIEPSVLLYIHLLPVGNGIKADLYVKPFETEPPYLRPTEGMTKITAIRNDKHIFTERVFARENKQVQLLMERCPVFASQAETEMSAHFDNPADCLQVLSELREATDLAVVEWPRGQRFSIRSKLTFNSFSMSVKKQNNWFDVNGSVQIDEQTVLDLKKMLQLLETSQGRFIEIEDGVYVELEKHFIRQLEYLKTVADVSSKGIKLHPLAAATNAGLFESAGSFEGDKEWNKFIDKIRKTENIKYQLPKGVDAELRPYQEEGYCWLRKMADWGTGACLADDMGLGKTLQCLTLLQSRAKEGPSMVVAPSSVCRNWMSEIEKFTPSMQAILFGGVDRKQMVETLEGGAILIVSYGLLHTEAELLTSRKWNVLILDEAHAIKNISTKRSQAAMSIDADFKIAATGTPLQNHMGELWNLFQFLNPGLLGSQQSFIERFVTPIERSNSELARRALKDLIKPFILRRTKNQVLTELPEKTEITISVELSDEERAFYEALRMKALEDLQKLDDTANAGEKQLRVLAEIMKLRRACCHPSLANKAVNIESSKLQRFEELVDTLIENGHKALVFSQFVGHLELMRELLDNKSISYEYLDGSTPGKEREESIKRFQAGSTDLFLISLKAGGVGLNLTAADYVIHMDPWWNPAVEDQASDRAHRIGQTKPVTIYRLVAKDTIEDRIVELHKNKRDLADSLLEGTEGAGKVTADELVALLRGM